MPAPPVYLDEGIDRPVAEALLQRGFDVLTALDAGRGEEPDDAQLEHATSLGLSCSPTIASIFAASTPSI
jgi:hypothetical protein